MPVKNGSVSKTTNFFGTCAVAVDPLEWYGEKWNLTLPRGFTWGLYANLVKELIRFWGLEPAT